MKKEFKYKVTNRKMETYYTDLEIFTSAKGKLLVSLYNKDGSLYTSPNLTDLYLFGDLVENK